MRTSSYLLLGAVASLATASGATLVQTQNFAFTPNGSQNQTFNRFDPSLGTLTGVTVTVVLDKAGGSFQVDNDSELGGTVNLEHSVQGSLSAAGVPLLRDDFSAIGASGTLTAISATSAELTATTGDDNESFNNTGSTDYFAFNPGTASDSDSGNISSGLIGSYVGNSTFTTTVTASQLVSATGVGGLQQAFTVSGVSGTVQVVYTYTPVPEPSAAVLLGSLGLLGFFRRRN